MNERLAMKRFYDAVGEHYSEEETVYKTLRGKLRRAFVYNWLRAQHGSLLEIGANRGMYLQLYDGGKRFGVDLSLTVLKQAHRQKPVHYAVTDAGRLGFADHSFDRVLCSEVIEHVLQPQFMLAEMARVLKPGGIALITTPNFKGERQRWVPLGDLDAFGVSGDWGELYFHTAYKPHELAEMADAAGLRPLETGTLEKDVKYAAKIPAAILLAGRFLNRMIKSKWFGRANEILFQKSQVWIYNACRAVGLDRLFSRWVREGVRSYVIVQKKGA